MTVVLAPLLAGCARSTMPSPDAALAEYARAAERGDADALYGMLTERGQKSLGKDGVARAVADGKTEIAEIAREATAPGARTESIAKVRWADGETATLTLEEGAFKVTAADTLPAGAKTPAQALEELRRVLARRSYAGLMRVLSKETKSAIEQSIRTLVEGLERPEGLDVTVKGDRATVQTSGGHVVRLKRESGVWTIEDVD
jgi:hypothetical protein